MKLKLLLLLVATCAGVFLLFAQETPGSKIQNSVPSVTKVPVVFSGGHETDPRDHGRPVVLIAAALGVSSDVFREAFSHVHPADPNVGPTGDEARRNKAALLGALSKYGVTNERLDAVSDYYRYVKSRGELWHTKPAVANALVKEGHVIGYEILKGGSGYSSPPSVSVPGIEDAVATAKLSFSQKFESNGTISAITVGPGR